MLRRKLGFGDPNGHGTSVGGIVGALDNGFGAVGTAPGATLWSARVLNRHGHGLHSNLVCGVDWVASTRTDSDPANDIAVANMSIGGPGQDDGNCGRDVKEVLHLAICSATAAGVTFVVAVGNDSSDAAEFAPAAYEEVITVAGMRDTDGLPGGLGGPGACDPADSTDDVFAAFSNYGSDIDVAAPAFCIGST